MDYIKEIVYSIIENEKPTAEHNLQLRKVCDVENELFDQLTKEQQDLYRKIELEILELESINGDHLIELTYKVCKELFCKN